MDYLEAGFNKFLVRKKIDSGPKNYLEDEASLNIEQARPTMFIRTGQSADRPIVGEKEGAVFYEKDTGKLYFWDNTTWKSVTAS